MQFTDCTVVITGASGNLGRAVAKAFADLGARLVLMDVRRGDVQDGANQVFLEVDLFKPDNVAAAVGKALERFGRIDVLCNIAGASCMGRRCMDATPTGTSSSVSTRAACSTPPAPRCRRCSGRRRQIVNIGAFAAQWRSEHGRLHRLEKRGDPPNREHGRGAAREEDQRELHSADDHRHAENRAAMPGADPRKGRPQDLAAVIVFLGIGCGARDPRCRHSGHRPELTRLAHALLLQGVRSSIIVGLAHWRGCSLGSRPFRRSARP
jgi:hypothetical protein